jgi:hypothetical protein
VRPSMMPGSTAEITIIPPPTQLLNPQGSSLNRLSARSHSRVTGRGGSQPSGNRHHVKIENFVKYVIEGICCRVTSFTSNRTRPFTCRFSLDFSRTLPIPAQSSDHGGPTASSGWIPICVCC